MTEQFEQRTWVVVPALNEAAVIRDSILGLKTVFPNVVVVDDGSDDATGKEALAAGAIVLRHPLNLGQGATIQTGIDFALGLGAAYIATFDADGQHDAKDLKRLVEVLARENVDIVLGSRFLGRTEGMTRTRSAVIRMGVLITNLTTGVRLTDAHNGMRAMTAATARRVHIRQDRMAHASELISQIGKLQLTVKEVPVTIRYSAYSRAKGQKMSNSFRILLDLVVGWLLR